MKIGQRPANGCSKEHTKIYREWFAFADADGDGRLMATDASKFFGMSGLSLLALKQVWDIVDSRQQGYLGFSEFVTAMQLISLAQAGKEITQDNLLLNDLNSSTPPVMEGLNAMLSKPKLWVKGVDPEMDGFPQEQSPITNKLVNPEKKEKVLPMTVCDVLKEGGGGTIACSASSGPYMPHIKSLPENDSTKSITENGSQNSREESFFLMWINSLGISCSVSNLCDDLTDGWLFLEIIDKVSPGLVDWSIAISRPMELKSKMLENCKQVSKIGKKLRFCLPTNFGYHIARGNRSVILNLLWELMKVSIYGQLKDLRFLSNEYETEIGEHDILAWANKRVGKSSRIESFQDRNISSGTFFLSLLNSLDPQSVDWSVVSKGQTAEEKKLNASYVIFLAKKLGCLVFMTPEDILEVNPKMMQTLTASIVSRHLKRQSSHVLNSENASSDGTCLSVSSRHQCSNPGDFVLKPIGQIVRKNFTLPMELYEGLFNYQKDSLNWFWRLHCEGNGGILADDMGLGKTRQTIIFILGLFHSQLIKRVLIVAPPTLLKQWAKEFLEQGSTVNIREYYGEQTERYDALHNVFEEGGVLLSSYDLTRRNYLEIIGDHTSQWDYLIIDEGHLIKNPRTDSFKALDKIPCSHKIVVSGTPVQNSTEELWTLFKFCHPRLLPDLKSFRRDFSLPMFMGNFKDSSKKEVLRSAKAAEDLRNITGPYILRRNKEVLIKSGAIEDSVLGNKTEFVVWLKLTALQEMLYRTQVRLYTDLRKRDRKDSKAKGTTFIAARLLQKIANHPLQLTREDTEELSETEGGLTDEIGVVDKTGIMYEMAKQLQDLVPEDATAAETSCKLKFVIQLLEKLLKSESGHRILIFSQTCQMLDTLEDSLSTAGYTCA